jgi:hypothetical protein
MLLGAPMQSKPMFLVVVLAALAVACSDPATSVDPSTTPTAPTAPAGTSPVPPGDTATSSAPACADFAGSCVAGSGACPAGTVRVGDASTVLCGSSSKSCCVPPPGSGAVVRKADYGLTCTKDGAFTAPDGTCGGTACALGCSCGLTGGKAACDCSRGLPSASPKGTEVCGLFSCGTITCGVGCHCSDAATSACACP